MNKHLIDLMERILNFPDDIISEELTEELIEYLSDSTLICPVDDDTLIGLQLGANTFIPACSDIERFREIFPNSNPKEVEFRKFSNYISDDMSGILINPGITGFVVSPAISRMVFAKISDRNKPPVTKGYDVKVRLNDLRPLTWRDLIIPENITFMELDDILKTLWNFNGHHLSCFLIKKDDLIIIDRKLSEETMMGCDFDANTTIIDDIFEKYDKVTYWYDFGDDWRFDIEIKKKIDYDKNYVTIKRYKGKYDPIEDCKGVYGLSEIIYLAENPDGEDMYGFGDWVDYLEEFDMEYAQRLLKNKGYVKSIWRQCDEGL